MTPSNQPRTRRSFLADTGMGFTGLALGAMLFQDGTAQAEEGAIPTGQPHHEPQAKSVIWIFSSGGVSHIESFDPKPELNRFTGKRVSETPHAGAVAEKYHAKSVGNMQIGSKKYGQSGIEVADWWPHIGSCADDLAVVRSLWVDDNCHGAQLTWHNGRHSREGGIHPTIGAWSSYGLGTLNRKLPQFVVLGGGVSECCGGEWAHGGGYLGPTYAGVRLNGRTGLPYLSPSAPRGQQERELEVNLLGRLNRLASVEYPDDADLQARIRAYELAFALQSSVPEAMGIERETAATRQMYGLDNPKTSNIGGLCLAARRLVERGVRFVQVYLPLGWDAHNDVVGNHGGNAAQCDQPIGALVKDLKQRGLLDETLVVWGTEFGRAPYNTRGRDHWADGFSCWLAGGGIKGGVVHGETDPFGFAPVTPPHYITDIHATVLHQMGLDSRRLTIPGRQRFDRDFGTPIREIIA
ncbi:MAG: DUF1501 domain-containing protein [Pirellulaceae bacterium]|nr:DUF1501 domain-containing protein [Pirellulaceae bacterium]